VDNFALSGRSILIVEEEPIVALQLEEQFHRAGAKVVGAGRLRDALHAAEHPALSVAVVNLRLGTDVTTSVCRRLSKLGIPFVIHTRHDTTEVRELWPDAPVLSKPTESSVVLKAAAGLMDKAPLTAASRR
jgi:DNA-binding response OmpR family regulator